MVTKQSLSSNFLAIKPFLDDEKMIAYTIAQICKDFSEFNVDIVVSHDIKEPYWSLIHSLTPHVNDMISFRFEKFINLLYRMDISEKKVKNALISGGNTDVKIAHLIIEKTLQKVLLRQHFKEMDCK